MGDEFALGRLKSEWRSPGNSSGWQGGAGKERVAIAREKRATMDCALCAKRKTALSPYSVDGQDHERATDLPDAIVDVIHRITTDPGRLSQRWYDEAIQAGLLRASGKENQTEIAMYAWPLEKPIAWTAASPTAGCFVASPRRSSHVNRLRRPMKHSKTCAANASPRLGSMPRFKPLRSSRASTPSIGSPMQLEFASTRKPRRVVATRSSVNSGTKNLVRLALKRDSFHVRIKPRRVERGDCVS